MPREATASRGERRGGGRRGRRRRRCAAATGGDGDDDDGEGDDQANVPDDWGAWYDDRWGGGRRWTTRRRHGHCTGTNLSFACCFVPLQSDPGRYKELCRRPPLTRMLWIHRRHQLKEFLPPRHVPLFHLRPNRLMRAGRPTKTYLALSSTETRRSTLKILQACISVLCRKNLHFRVFISTFRTPVAASPNKFSSGHSSTGGSPLQET
jgi:hypothetical protein